MKKELADWNDVFDILFKQIRGWGHSIIELLPNFVVAVLVILIFFLLAGVVHRVLSRILRRFSQNDTVAGILSTSVYVLIILVGIFVALGVLQLEKTVTSLLAGAGVIGIALGLAFQDIASNFIAGIFIAFMKPFKVGDIVQVDNTLGQIYRIDIRTTSVMTFDDLELMIPNKDMFTKTITNYTTTPRRRLEIRTGVSYGDDLRKAKRVAQEALETVVHRTTDPVSVFFTGFGDSSINFKASIWIQYPGNGNFDRACDDAIIKLKDAFDREGISIPYPIRTLDFAIKDGASLRDELSKSNQE